MKILNILHIGLTCLFLHLLWIPIQTFNSVNRKFSWDLSLRFLVLKFPSICLNKVPIRNIPTGMWKVIKIFSSRKRRAGREVILMMITTQIPMTNMPSSWGWNKKWLIREKYLHQSQKDPGMMNSQSSCDGSNRREEQLDVDMTIGTRTTGEDRQKIQDQSIDHHHLAIHRVITGLGSQPYITSQKRFYQLSK